MIMISFLRLNSVNAIVAVKLSAAALLALASHTLFAESAASSYHQEKSSDYFYVKMTVGSSIFDDLDTDAGTVVNQSRVGNSFAVAGGIVLGDLLGFELGHNVFGSTDATVAGTSENFNSESSVSSNAISVIPRFPLGEKMGVHAELGQHIWEVETKQAGVSSVQDGSDIFFGFGFDYKINQHFKAGVEFNRYNIDSASFDNTSVALTYKF